MTIVLSEDRVNLNTPAIKSGPLTLAELHAARCPPCHGMCHQGRQCNADACAPEGGQHADPVPSGIVSMRRHRQTRASVALALALAVAGYLAHIAWPLLG